MAECGFRLLVSLSKHIQLSRRAWPKTLHKLDEICTIFRRGPRGKRVLVEAFLVAIFKTLRRAISKVLILLVVLG